MFLLAVLMAPLGSAAKDEGTFLVLRETTFPPGARLTFDPLLVLDADTLGLTELQVNAPSARLRVFEQRLLRVSTDVVMWTHALETREATDVMLHSPRISLLGGSEEGFIAFQTGPTASATFEAASEVTLEARARTSEANFEYAVVGENESDANLPYYRCVVRVPHMFAEGSGFLHYSGPGGLKLLGPNLWVDSEEWRGALRTGIESDSGEAAERMIRRWVVLEFTDAEVSMSSETAWKLAASSFGVDWTGAASFSPLEGELDAKGAHYRSSGQRTLVRGTFEGHLLPLKRDTTLLTRFDLQGTLDSTTLRAQSVPLAAQVSRNPMVSPWLFVGVAVVVAAAGGYRVAIVRKRGATAPLRPLSVEECLDAGSAAASQDDWPEAAVWFVRAHELAPTSARMCADAAFALSQIADHDGALRLFEEASRLSTDGEADFNGALAALRANRPDEEVERWLARCLLRSPEMVLNLDEDEEWAHLRGRATFEGILARAWRALHERGFG